MIAFFGYASLVSLLLVAAAAASEPLLRAIHRPTRSVWLAAMLGTCILALSVVRVAPRAMVAPITSATSRDIIVASRETGIAPPTGDPAPTLERSTVRSSPVSDRASPYTTPRVARLAAVCWLLASLACLLRLVAGARRVARLRRCCRAGQLHGEPVLVSESTGPAVLGVRRHQIVVPAWVEELGEDAQRLILAHEREHIRVRDPLFLHAASVVVALIPWNLPLWFALRRLREAIEIDCDARVLRRQVGAARRYCRLLLEVGERTVAVASPLLALAEPATLLERRIDSVTTTPRLRDWKTLVPAAGAVLLLAGACRAPSPEIAPADAFGLLARTRSVATGDRSDAIRSIVTPSRLAEPRRVPALTVRQSAPGEEPRALAAPGVARFADVVTTSTAPSVSDTVADATVRNEAALQRSAADNQARVDAIADSVILADYPELASRTSGPPAFLALVLDDRNKLMRHAVSFDSTLPNDLAAAMLSMRIDTISGRTIELGIARSKRWNVTVGHAVEALGPVRGHTEMRAWRSSQSLPYALRRVPYQRIVDSVARVRAPEAYREHEGTFAIAMLLEEDGRVTAYAAQPRADSVMQHELPVAMMKRMLGDTTMNFELSGVIARLQPARTTIVWGVRR